MADTREFYLVCNDGTIFGSDPKTQYNYLDMSENSSLNSKASSAIYNFKNQFRVIDDYDVTIILTFNSRVEREEFALNYIDKIWAFGVTSRVDKSITYTKRAMVTNYEYVNNDFINGIQTEITLQLTGQWQSDLSQYLQPAPDDNGDGTKKYYGGSLYGINTNLLEVTSASFALNGDGTFNQWQDIAAKPFNLQAGVPVFFKFDMRQSSNNSSISVLVQLNGGRDGSGHWEHLGAISPTSSYQTFILPFQPLYNHTGTALNIRLDNVPASTTVYAKNMSLNTVGDNLLQGTSNQLVTVNNATGWSTNLATIDTNRTDLTGEYTASIYANPTTHDVAIFATLAKSNGTRRNNMGNTIAAGSSGYSYLTITPAAGEYIHSVWLSFTTLQTDSTAVSYKNMKLEPGGIATPWVPNTSDSNYNDLMGSSYQYYKPDENINAYKYGSTNYSNQIKLATEDNQFIIYVVLNSGLNKVTISNSKYSVELRAVAAYNGTLAPIGSEGITYNLSDRDTVDKFSLWNGGGLISDYWTVDNPDDYFTLLTIFDTIKTDPVSVIAQGSQGATLPYSIYTYSKHDFI